MKAGGRRQKEEERPKGEVRRVWVCFAVKEEAEAFRRLARGKRNIKLILTGMGKSSAERAIRAAMAEVRPELVLSSGFAGGLRPDLRAGMAVFAADADTGLEPALLAAGAKPVLFYCADRVAATAAEKQALREKTGADAVEMESESIRTVCRELGIPCTIVRVILDEAGVDLPLDLNRLLTADQKISHGKLAVALAKSPRKILALVSLQRQAQLAAVKLAEILSRVTGV